MTGRHRSPPPDPRPDWRWHTIAALAALGILAPPVSLAAAAVAPDARGVGVHGTTVAPTASATPTVLTAGPLAIPEIGVVAPAVESLYPTPSAAPRPTAAVSRGTRTPQTTPKAVSEPLVAITDASQQTVTPAPQPVTEDQPAEAPSPDPVTAAQESATPTEEPVVPTPTPTPDVTVDVTAEVTP